MKYPGGFLHSALVTSGEVPCVGPPPKGQPVVRWNKRDLTGKALFGRGFRGEVRRWRKTNCSGDPQLLMTERLSERWGIAKTEPTGAVVWASFASK
jgi:hypothetical protein